MGLLGEGIRWGRWWGRGGRKGVGGKGFECFII